MACMQARVDGPTWIKEKIKKLINTGEICILELPMPVKTSWGILHFCGLSILQSPPQAGSPNQTQGFIGNCSADACGEACPR